MKHFPFPLYLNTPTWRLTDGDCADALLGVPIKYKWRDTFFFFFAVVNSIIIAVTSLSQRNLPFVLRIKLGRRRKRGKKKRKRVKGTFRKNPTDARSAQAWQRAAVVRQEPVQAWLLSSNSGARPSILRVSEPSPILQPFLTSKQVS